MKLKIDFKVWLPILLFILLCGFLYTGLSKQPHELPSPLIGHPVPSFHLQTVRSTSSDFTDQDLQGHVSLVHVWATWCGSCRYEYGFISAFAKKSKVPFYGIAYKDGARAVKDWVAEFGTPYQKIGLDESGQVGINWGVYGTPETYLVDKAGIVRYKYSGPISLAAWRETILPEVMKLQGEK